MTGIRGIGFQGLMNPIFSAVCLSGLNAWNFDPTLVSMTASMAKRLTSVFAASPIVQGKRDGSDVGDCINFSPGTNILTGFYPNLDTNQGSITLRMTPEWNGNDNIEHRFLADLNLGGIRFYKTAGNALAFFVSTLYAEANISSWTAGTTYNICFRWDLKNKIDGTNYACVSINDVHTFGSTSGGTALALANLGIGYCSDTIIEGLTIYRRVLYDGTYGVNVGNGDEVALIAAGVDPTTVTGSWDVVFCLPTNASAGALTTGTGNAWSHPHSSNLLTRGFLSDRYYGGTNQWGVKFNGTSTYINCGSGATLDNLADNEFTFEVWIKPGSVSSFSTPQAIVSKDYNGIVGWIITLYDINGNIRSDVYCATSPADSLTTGGTNILDEKWHHIVIYFNDAGDRKIYVAVDGKWASYSIQDAASGTVNDDSSRNLYLGVRDADTLVLYTPASYGWVRISNNDRYSHGTNFVPPRTIPAVDGNTVEQWNLNEGTGATATASVTTPGNNGTISNGTWEQQWFDEGSPVMLQSVIPGTTHYTDVGSGATIDDLADNAFTVDGWFRFDPRNVATEGSFVHKGNASWGSGWLMQYRPAYSLIRAAVICGTTNAISSVTVPDTFWHYWKMTFDDAGDRKIRIYMDNVECSYDTQTAGVGAIVSDAALSGEIGGIYGGAPGISYNNCSQYGWIRWSNVVRGAGMIPRSNPPAVDGNTVAQWNATDGAGATLTDSSGNANHGTMAGTYTWNNSPAMESDSPSARQYAWGYVVGSDAANEGTKQVYAVTAGNDYALSASAYSEDGVAQPEIVIYDETGAAAIATVLGTTTSTEKVPDRFHITFEAPVGCASISIKLLNATATGVVGWQQIQLRTNLWTDPSFETGTAVTDIGTPTTSAQSADQAHTGTNSWKIVADAADEGIKRTITVVSGKFYTVRAWIYISTAAKTVDMEFTGGSIQDGISTYRRASTVGAWQTLACVVRATSTSLEVKFTSNDAQTFYVDDVEVLLDDDVTLTCTPASAANSVESSGIRVDGYDSAPQTIPANSIFANQGWIKFAWIPRHSAADVAKFGNTTPAIAQIYGDADDYITLDWSAANTIRLRYNANGAGVQTGTWDATGAIVAGTTYQMEIKYLPSGMELIVGGTTRITITAAVAFGTVPTLFYPGSLQAGGSQVDAVFLAPT